MKVPTVNDLAWLAGRWEGTMTNGPGVADVTFAPPSAGLITGVMRLVDKDKVLVVELISIVDTPKGPEMRFRHFSSALEAYELTFRQAMRLTRQTDSTFVFENTIPYDKDVSSTQPRVTTYIRRGADVFVGRSEIIDSKGKPGVIEVTYRRRR
jgi:hypothetical protein